MSIELKHRRIEDYLVAIYNLARFSSNGWINNSILSEFLGLSNSTITEAVQRLKSMGLCIYIPYRGVRLTNKGEKIAFKHILKREILECLYNYILKFEIDNRIASEICSIEHYITDESIARICKILNIPSRCPHGAPLPCKNTCLNDQGCPLR